MGTSNGIADRYGLTLSTSSAEAAERYTEGTDLIISWNYGGGKKIKQAIEADEGFALAHGAQAVILYLQGKAPEAKAAIERARALAKHATRREQQHVEALALYVSDDGPGCYSMVKEHLGEYPRDYFLLNEMGFTLLFYGCSIAGVPRYPDELLSLYKSVESAYSDDWAFLGMYSFAHHETGAFAEALDLAERSLKLLPINAQACHSVAHSLFEMGEATDGDQYLSEWLKTYDRRAPFHVHLSWHLALFQLAQGQYSRVLQNYMENIRPSVVTSDAYALDDSASLMWRWELYSNSVPPVEFDDVVEVAKEALKGPGPAYRDLHSALAFGTAGDWDKLNQLIDRLQGDADKGHVLTAEATLPVIKALSAFAQDDVEEAVRILDPLFDGAGFYPLVRIGASHAQREVCEDTLLEAYLYTERFDKAEKLLEARLKRRPSARDLFWLSKAQAGKGNLGGARANLRSASEGWSGADSDTPEAEAVKKLAAQVN